MHDQSEVLHFGDGILAGIVYFGFRNWMGSQSTALEQKTASKKLEAHQNWRTIDEEVFAGYGWFGCTGHGVGARFGGGSGRASATPRLPRWWLRSMTGAVSTSVSTVVGPRATIVARTRPASCSATMTSNGGTVGGQVGYRWQTGQFVFGLEAQGNWADISGSTANLLAPGATIRSKMDAFGLFTGQVGYAWNNVLLYAKGGAAVTDRNYDFVLAGGALVPRRIRHPLEPDRGRWPRIRLRPELVDRRRIQPHLRRSSQRDLRHSGRRRHCRRPRGWRHRHGPRPLNYRWGGPVIAKY